MNTQHTIVIMAGGTGGHIFPGLAVATVLQNTGFKTLWLGAKGLELSLVPKANIELTSLSIKGLRGNGLRGWLAVPFNLTKAVIEAYGYLKRVKPACVIGFGGFASVPGGIAARLLNIPVIIHEQNAVAGLSNRLLARISAQTLTGFPCGLKNSVVVGNPVRATMLTSASPKERYDMRGDQALNVLILGGSQGARFINALMPKVAELITIEANFWHQTGGGLFETAQSAWVQAGQTPYKIEPFIDDMVAAYAWADIVVCRSGALTIAELSAVGVASILIPFPHAVDDHQTENAKYLYNQGAAILLPEQGLEPQQLAEHLDKLTRISAQAMAEHALRQAKPQAAQMIATAAQSVIK